MTTIEPRNDLAGVGAEGPKDMTFSKWLAAKLGPGSAATDVANTAQPGQSPAVDDAYQEFLQRRDNGEEVDAEEFCVAHSAIQSSLDGLLRAHLWLANNPQLLPKSKPQWWPTMGQQFLGFQMIRQLGHGTFANVYLARQPELGGRAVVLKVSPDGAAEANMLGRIRHENIVPVYSVERDEANDLTAVCMPYLGSTTLCDVLNRVKGAWSLPPTLPNQDLANKTSDCELTASHEKESPLTSVVYLQGIRLVGAKLADALHYIHEMDIVHRDLKPSNVLITAEGEPMLLDFNLSADARTVQKRMGGTLPYMSPEQLRAMEKGAATDLKLVGPQSDLFSLAVMLFELVTGQLPFGPVPCNIRRRDIQPLLLEKQKQGPTSVNELNPSVDPEFAAILEQCLAFDPAQRPRSAAVLAAALRGEVALRRTVARRNSAHRWLTAAAACLILLSTGTAVSWWSQHGADQAKLWAQGQEFYREAKYTSAIENFSAILEKDPNHYEALLARARAYMKKGESDPRQCHLAMSDFLHAETIRPSGEIKAGLGYCILRVRISPVDAIFQFEKAIQLGFATAEVHNNLAYCLMYRSRFAEAEMHLDKALQLKPNFQAAIHNRGMVRFNLAVTKGNSKTPAKQSSPLVNPAAVEERCQVWLEQSKADILKALETDPASMELNRNALSVWAFSTRYTPGDLDAAFNYLQTTISLGYDAKIVAADRDGLRTLHGDPRFDEILKLRVATQTLPPTNRIVDPLGESPG